MFRRLSLGILFFLVSLPALAQEYPQYKIQATIDDAAKTVAAFQTVTFTNTSDQDIHEVYFHVYPNRQYSAVERSFMVRYASYFKMDPPKNFLENKFEISKLQVAGAAASFTLEGTDKTLLRIPLSTPLAPGQSTIIDLDFNLTIPHSFGRFGWYQDVIALARWYPMLCVLGKEGWDQSPFYPFHRPFFSESAYYNVDLTVANNQTVIHSGDRMEEKSEGTLKKIHIQTLKPIREFSLAMSESYKLYQEEKNGITFKAYYLGNNLDHAKLAIEDAEDLMGFYTQKFGPYPYTIFSIAPVYLAYGGEQMSNMIFIDTRVFEMPRFLDRYFDFLIAHETGHQWFYNLIGTNNYTQMWLEEGINSYFLMDYLSQKYGENATVLQVPRWIKFFIPEFTFKRAQDVRYKMAQRVDFEEPVVNKLSSFREPSSVFTFTYGKGSRVVQMLKYLVGEDSFNRIFQRVFKEYRYRNLDIESFKRIAAEESKKDLNDFFDQWLYTTKSLDQRVDDVKGSSIYVSHKGDALMPVQVNIYYKDDSADQMTWDGKQPKDILTAPSDKLIASVGLDEHKELLDVDRVNNYWPRKINARFVPVYHGLWDIPVFLPEDGYNWITGPNFDDGIGFKTSFQKPYDYNVYVQSSYNFSDNLQTTRQGVLVNNVFHSQTTFGIEAMQRADYDTGEDNLNSQKVYVRRELWPAPYSLTDINDHVTAYVMRNRTPSGALLSSESISNTSYLRHNEAIVGALLHLDRSGTHPDVSQGFQTDLLIENSGHFAGATQTFTRASIDQVLYHPWIGTSKMAYRIKYGGGSSNDKNLYELGGADGLRGFDRKTIRGSNVFLGTAEFRFPLVNNLRLNSYDHVLILDRISGVVFFDAGQAWYDNFDDAHFHKDVGAGLRFHVSIGSFLENLIFRLDVAQAVAESKQDPHVWFGINQAF